MNMKNKIASALMLMTTSFGLNVNAASIPDDAERYNGHYYKVYDRSMTWSEARRYCAQRGGHLVTINSQGEQDFLIDLIQEYGNKNCYWIGGHKNSRGEWRWITNENTYYANWAKGQPDNYTGDEDCAMMYRRRNPEASSHIGQWNDIDNDGECNGESFFGTHNFGFICEWESRSSKKSRHYDYYDEDDD